VQSGKNLNDYFSKEEDGKIIILEKLSSITWVLSNTRFFGSGFYM